MIPHLRPWVTQEDSQAVSKALEGRQLATWRAADALKEALADYSGAESCHLYATGGLALGAAIASLGLPTASGVGIPAFTCPEVARAVISAGCTPVVLDTCDRGVLSEEAARLAYDEKRIAACVVVHQFGAINPQLDALAEAMPVVEDTAHVPPKFHLQHSRAAAGSLEGTKLLGAGEGGYMLTRERIRQPEAYAIANRLPDPVAVLAHGQLNRLDENLARREAIAKHYANAAPSAQLVEGSRLSWFRFLVRLQEAKGVEAFIEHASAQDITVRRPIMPAPLSATYGGSTPQANSLWESLASVPLYPDLTESEIDRITYMLSSFKGWT